MDKSTQTSFIRLIFRCFYWEYYPDNKKKVEKDLISSTDPSLIVADGKIGASKSMQMTYLLLDYFIT